MYPRTLHATCYNAICTAIHTGTTAFCLFLFKFKFKSASLGLNGYTHRSTSRSIRIAVEASFGSVQHMQTISDPDMCRFCGIDALPRWYCSN